MGLMMHTQRWVDCCLQSYKARNLSVCSWCCRHSLCTAMTAVVWLTCESSQDGNNREGNCKVGESREASFELLRVSKCCEFSLSAVNCCVCAADARVRATELVLVAERILVVHHRICCSVAAASSRLLAGMLSNAQCLSFSLPSARPQQAWGLSLHAFR